MTKKETNKNNLSVSKDNQALEYRRLKIIGSDTVHKKKTATGEITVQEILKPKHSSTTANFSFTSINFVQFQVRF